MYDIDGGVVLTAGGHVPATGKLARRSSNCFTWQSNESVGQGWEVMEGIVSARVNLGGGKLHVISCYAPRAATREAKNTFMSDLNNVLLGFPERDKYIALGDLNSRVGSRQGLNGEQSAVLGPFGVGYVNEAGTELIESLEEHQGKKVI